MSINRLLPPPAMPPRSLRKTGRTTGMILQALGLALQNQGQWVVVKDHMEDANNAEHYLVRPSLAGCAIAMKTRRCIDGSELVSLVKATAQRLDLQYIEVQNYGPAVKLRSNIWGD